mgnify:CR=1 FL=1
MDLCLDDCCIETAARRARARIAARLLETDERDRRFGALAADLELVDRFLSHTDFATLRAARPELDGRTSGAVAVEPGADDGAVVCGPLRPR